MRHRQTMNKSGEPNSTPYPNAKITLKVHPFCGDTVRVLKPYGPDRVWVEHAEGDVRIIPVAWTDLWPRCDVAAVGDRKVLLTPLVLRGLAAWVAARVAVLGDRGC